VIALILGLVGIYGVISYVVSRRTREIGVRMALGAGAPDVVWLVMREAWVLLGAGLVLGLPASVALGRYVRGHLFGVHVADPLTLASAVFSLALAASLAGFVPARRASRVDPLVALHYE
jgi:ABC-type antimicrobial peptide transport system permease subunit